MNKYILSLTTFLSFLMFISCTADEPRGPHDLQDTVSPLRIYAGIGNNVSTRAVRNTVEDEWSYTAFEDGDEMGFYSSGGNFSEDEGRGGFDNEPLTYDGDGTNFTSADGKQFSPTHMSGSQIYMYFPFSGTIGTTGYELRVFPENGSNELRCIDYLSSNEISLAGKVNGENVALYGSFKHSFAELIIMRGEGFDAPPEGLERITAVLNMPVTDIKVNITGEGNTWKCTPELFYDSVNPTLSKEDATKWIAWEGGNYGITTEDPVGRPASYVIVPTLGCENGINKQPGIRTLVEYIELYDNEGYLQRVSTLELALTNGMASKYVDAGWRYPMEITMKELVPTVNPFRIIPWNEDVVLTDERKRGINDMDEFAQWVRDYNAYLLEKDDPAKRTALLQYGDLYQDAEKGDFWHFYILNDLDLTNYSPLPSEDGAAPDISNGVIVPVLEDILDGISTNLVDGKFENYKISGLTSTFIGQLSGINAVVQNVDFISPDVRINDASTAAVGIISLSITDGSVVNCNIDDATLFNPDGPVGMVSGTMSGGVVKECVLSGFMSGTSTATGDAEKIIGVNPTNGAIVENNDTAGVIM